MSLPRELEGSILAKKVRLEWKDEMNQLVRDHLEGREDRDGCVVVRRGSRVFRLEHRVFSRNGIVHQRLYYLKWRRRHAHDALWMSFPIQDDVHKIAMLILSRSQGLDRVDMVARCELVVTSRSVMVDSDDAGARRLASDLELMLH